MPKTYDVETIEKGRLPKEIAEVAYKLDSMIFSHLGKMGFSRVWVAGGCIRKMLSGESERHLKTDIDLYFSDLDAMKKTIKAIKKRGGSIVWKRDRVIRMSDSDGNMYDIVDAYVMNPQNTISTFDFTACAIAYDGHALYMMSPTMTDIRNRTLRIMDCYSTANIHSRIQKYSQKGYVLSKEESKDLTRSLIARKSLEEIYSSKNPQVAGRKAYGISDDTMPLEGGENAKSGYRRMPLSVFKAQKQHELITKLSPKRSVDRKNLADRVKLSRKLAAEASAKILKAKRVLGAVSDDEALMNAWDALEQESITEANHKIEIERSLDKQKTEEMVAIALEQSEDPTDDRGKIKTKSVEEILEHFEISETRQDDIERALRQEMRIRREPANRPIPINPSDGWTTISTSPGNFTAANFVYSRQNS